VGGEARERRRRNRRTEPAPKGRAVQAGGVLRTARVQPKPRFLKVQEARVRDRSAQPPNAPGSPSGERQHRATQARGLTIHPFTHVDRHSPEYRSFPGRLPGISAHLCFPNGQAGVIVRITTARAFLRPAHPPVFLRSAALPTPLPDIYPARAPAARRLFTGSAVVRRADQVLRENGRPLWIRSGVSKWSANPSAHCCFTPRDDQAELRCTRWAQAARSLPTLP
jgi:hypothetical protein